MIRLLFTKSRSLSTSPRQRLSLAFNPLLPGPAIRLFRTSVACRAIKPFLLADIGEGIREVQIIQWFVREGARVEQFQAICEVQSDKATVEITSRFDGIIKKLHYETDDMATVGKPLVDIDIQSEISKEDEALVKTEEQDETNTKEGRGAVDIGLGVAPTSSPHRERQSPQDNPKSNQPRLATPAVRHSAKELDIDISQISGTGKDGRVLMEDVQNFAADLESPPRQSQPQRPPPPQLTKDTTVPLKPIQTQMYRSMTRSLSVPHFLYTDTVDTTNLTRLRHTLNSKPDESHPKISALAFIVKAVSQALTQYPLLNARLDTSTDTNKPLLHYRAAQNVGVAVDSPHGLLVPVIHAVQNHSIVSIASELHRLAALARVGKLSLSDMSGGTFTVSNVGSIGGGAVAPVLVEGQTAILGVGRARAVPAFDGEGRVVRREECVFSWSADHRVVDGAAAARCAEAVRSFVEDPGSMMVGLR